MEPIIIAPTRKAYAVVWWEGQKKTICWDKEDLDNALSRYREPGDFYYQKYHEVEYDVVV